MSVNKKTPQYSYLIISCLISAYLMYNKLYVETVITLFVEAIPVALTLIINRKKSVKFLREELKTKYGTNLEKKSPNYIISELNIRKTLRKAEDDLKFNRSISSENGRYTFECIKLSEILEDNKNYVIVGEAGIGKTSILYEMALKILLNEINSPFIPFVLHLRHLVDIHNKNDFKSLINTYYHYEEYNLTNYRFLFLLDGLDEINEPKNVIDNIKERNIFIENSKIILTTRHVGYNWLNNKEKNYEYLKILPFNDEKIEKYLGKLYDNKNFQELYKENKDLMGMPILLRMVKDLGSDGILGIKNRADLYDKFIKHLIKWEKEKLKDKYGFTNTRLITCLAKISFCSMEDGEFGFVSRENVLKYLKSEEKIEKIIDWGVTLNLVEENDNETFFYTHRSFQEYFAALNLKDNILTAGINEKFIKEKLNSFNWDEVWLFLIGSLPKEQSKELIEIIYKYDYILAIGCIKQYKGDKKEFAGIKEKCLRLLDDKNPSSLKQVAATLGSVGSKGDTKYLIDILNSENESSQVTSIRMKAFESLGKIGSNKDAEYLLSIFKNKKYEHRDSMEKAAEALGKIMDDNSLILSLKTMDNFHQGYLSYHTLKTKDIKSLINLLKNEDFFIKKEVATVLRNKGSRKDVKYLLPLLKNDDKDVRIQTLRILRRIGSRNDVKYLLPLLKDKESSVRMEVIHSLEHIDPKHPNEYIMPLLKENNDSVTMLQALKTIGSNEDVKYLVPFLKEEDEHILTDVTKILGEIGSEKDVKYLLPQLENKSRFVRSATCKALGNLGSKKHAKYLLPLLKDVDDLVRENAVRALGEIGSEKDVKYLIPLLKDENPEVQNRTVYALINLPKLNEIHCLDFLLSGENVIGRREATLKLGEIGSEKDVKYLIPLLKDEDYMVRYNASWALGEIGSEKDSKYLIPLLKDKDTHVQREAATSLGKISSVEYIISLLKDVDDLVRENAVITLGKVGSEKDVKYLLPLLKDQNSSVRAFTASTVGEIGSNEYVKHLLPLLKDENHFVQSHAVRALEKIGSGKDAKYLLPLLKTDYYDIHMYIEVLVKLFKLSDSNEQDQLVQDLFNLSENMDSYHETYINAIEEIKKATGRRFLNISF